jgi:N-methylhydantoinase A/oxoprolinase/acetone carboxylase beta subunit
MSAEPLGLSTLEAAEAILKVANSRMAGAIRLVSIERGFDPRSASPSCPSAAAARCIPARCSRRSDRPAPSCRAIPA